MKQTLLISLLILASALLFPARSRNSSTDFTVKGIVVDSKTKRPVEYADVLLVEGADHKPVSTGLTESNGHFKLTVKRQGTFRLMARMIGYDTYESAELHLGSSHTTIDLKQIPLLLTATDIEEVEIVGRKKQVVYRLDKRVVEAGSNLNNAGGTAVDVLRNAPSISVDVEGNVKFRGDSGFKVYVNGRPSLWSGTDALEQIPAGQIDNIEIITTPSAKYETDGTVGILNVILKKNTSESFMGIVNLTGNTNLSRAGDFLISQKNGGLTWSAGGNASMYFRKSNYEQSKFTLINDTSDYNEATGKRVGRNYNYSLKGSVGYEWTKTRLQFDAEGGYRGSGYEGNLNYVETVSVGYGPTQTDHFRSYDYKDLHETYFTGNLSFGHDFERKGQSLSGYFFATYGGDAIELFESDLYNQKEQRERGHRAREAEYRMTMRGDLTYKHPFRKEGMWESGYQYNMYMEDGDYNINLWNPAQQQFIPWDEQYSRYVFRRDVHTLFSMASDKIGKFQYQVGVRAEYTHRRMECNMAWADHRENRVELFPSAHVGYSFGKSNTISGGYSRRTTRPELYFMEPYITYVDIYTAQIGNPAVRPEYIDAFDLGYKKDFGENYVAVELFHRFRKDKIERIKGIYSQGVTLDSIANIGNDYSTGAEATAQLALKRWWSLNLTGSLYNYLVENQFKVGDEDTHSLNWQARFANTFNVTKTTTVQFDGELVGPSVSTQGRTDAYFFANLGIKQQMLKRKLSASLIVRDLFATARYTGVQRAPGVEVNTTIRPYSPLLQLTLTYTFNNYKGKGNVGGFNDLFEGTNR